MPPTISISMQGAKEAVETIRDLVIPWYRENAAQKIKLEHAESQARIQKLKAETLTLEATRKREEAAVDLDTSQRQLILAQAKKTEAEATLILQQAAKAAIEVQSLKAQFQQAYIDLAFIVARHHGDGKTEAQLAVFALKLLPVIEKIINSEIVPNTSEELDPEAADISSKIDILGIELNVEDTK